MLFLVVHFHRIKSYLHTILAEPRKLTRKHQSVWKRFLTRVRKEYISKLEAWTFHNPACHPQFSFQAARLISPRNKEIFLSPCPFPLSPCPLPPLAPCPLPLAPCPLPLAPCPLPLAPCPLPLAPCPLPLAPCPLPLAPCPLPLAPCPLPLAPCPLPLAPCPLPLAPCPKGLQVVAITVAASSKTT